MERFSLQLTYHHILNIIELFYNFNVHPYAYSLICTTITSDGSNYQLLVKDRKHTIQRKIRIIYTYKQILDLSIRSWDTVRIRRSRRGKPFLCLDYLANYLTLEPMRGKQGGQRRGKEMLLLPTNSLKCNHLLRSLNMMLPGATINQIKMRPEVGNSSCQKVYIHKIMEQILKSSSGFWSQQYP